MTTSILLVDSIIALFPKSKIARIQEDPARNQPLLTLQQLCKNVLFIARSLEGSANGHFLMFKCSKLQ